MAHCLYPQSIHNYMFSIAFVRKRMVKEPYTNTTAPHSTTQTIENKNKCANRKVNAYYSEII